jgi:hypothetical protein
MVLVGGHVDSLKRFVYHGQDSRLKSGDAEGNWLALVYLQGPEKGAKIEA